MDILVLRRQGRALSPSSLFIYYIYIFISDHSNEETERPGNEQGVFIKFNEYPRTKY